MKIILKDIETRRYVSDIKNNQVSFTDNIKFAHLWDDISEITLILNFDDDEDFVMCAFEVISVLIIE